MTLNQRAMQIWALLVCAARERKTYTYDDVATALGMPGAAHVVGRFFGPLWTWCKRMDYPPLTVLVVNQSTGVPGIELGEDLNIARERVFGFDWFSIEPPSDADLGAAADD